MSLFLKKQLPTFSNLDAYVDYVLKYIKPLSGALGDTKLFTNKRFKEFNDSEDFNEDILYIFKDDGTLLISVDGNVSEGHWESIDNKKSLLIKTGGKAPKMELYDLAFLSDEFMILKKHGNQKRIGKKKYLLLGLEGPNSKLEWYEVMEKIFDLYQKNWVFSLLIMAGIFLFLIIIISVFFLN